MSAACGAALVVFLVATLGLDRSAEAQTGTGGTTGTSALAASDILIVVQQSPGVALADFDLQRFFNVNNCQCNTPVYLYFTFTQSGFAKKATVGDGTVEFWEGLNCGTSLGTAGRNCRSLGDTVSLQTFANNSGVVIPTDTQSLSQNFGQPATSGVADGGLVTGSTGPSGPDACTTGVAFSQFVYMLVTFNGASPYSVVVTLTVNVDLAPPPSPTDVTVMAGNEALITNWTGIDTATTAGADLLGYQLLCDRGGALQVFPSGSFTAGFQSCATNQLPSGLDANVRGLDPRFICSPMLSTLSSSFRIKILENAVTYGVSVVAIDTHYNPSSPEVLYQAPQKTFSFYDVYRNGDSANHAPGDSPDPGRASGGYCAVASGTGGAVGVAGLATLVGLFVILATRRGRRGSRR